MNNSRGAAFQEFILTHDKVKSIRLQSIRIESITINDAIYINMNYNETKPIELQED